MLRHGPRLLRSINVRAASEPPAPAGGPARGADFQASCLLALISAGLLMTGCRQPAAEIVDSQPAAFGPLRLMTFNIRYATADDGENRWERRRAHVIELIRSRRPDIVGLQEVLHSQFQELCAALPEFAATGVGRDDGRTGGEYAPILFRARRFEVLDFGTFWFSDTPDVPGSKSWGNSIPRICTRARLRQRDVGGPTLSVYNVHLDHVSAASRLRSVDALMRRIAARPVDDPVIVMGDFNAGENSPEIVRLRTLPLHVGPRPSPPARTLADTFRMLHPDAADVGTYHAFRGDRGGAKIDYVFVDPRFETLEAEIVHEERDGRYPSDHFPVAAVVAWEGE